MTSRRHFIVGGLALTGLSLTGPRGCAAAKPAVTVHRSPT